MIGGSSGVIYIPECVQEKLEPMQCYDANAI
jgi:hypothetical protein